MRLSTVLATVMVAVSIPAAARATPADARQTRKALGDRAGWSPPIRAATWPTWN